MGERLARGSGVEMSAPVTATRDLVSELAAAMPKLRGRLIAGQKMADITWFRVGGPATMFSPADEEDLSYFLAHLPGEVPVTAVGVGSNLLVRDGGIDGVVIRLGRGFNETSIEGDLIRAGTAVPDVRLAQVAADASLAGLAFYRGVPGTVGGALRMNAGAYQRETKDALVEARALDRKGNVHVLKNADFNFSYRHSGMPKDFIATQAIYRGTPGDKATIKAEMDKITEAREATQPIKSRTGGSTFKNPPGSKSWQLIDAAGCRGLVVGDAQVSELHCNFLINRGNATGADIENLGEEVRRRVKENSGVELEWEIVRLGNK
jgi:UDP-N-acetylmuramate dehydrogenase